MDLKRTVLLIEDDQESHHNLVHLLSKHFSNVLSAYDGHEGWRLYRHHRPDIILSDIQMPHSDGLELIQKIRTIDEECFIAVLSAHSDQHRLMRAVSLKLDAYILKPITLQKLNSLYQKIGAHRQNLHRQLCSLAPNTTYDFLSKTATKGGVRVSLANREISLLELLIEHRGDAVSYTMIEYALCDTQETTPNAIKILISHLRKKLGITIISIPKVGYFLP